MIRGILAIICVIAAGVNLAYGDWIAAAGFAVLGLLFVPADQP